MTLWIGNLKTFKTKTMKAATKEQVQDNQKLIDKLRAKQSEAIGEYNQEKTLLFNEIIITLEQNNIVLKNA